LQLHTTGLFCMAGMFVWLENPNVPNAELRNFAAIIRNWKLKLKFNLSGNEGLMNHSL